MERDTKRPIRNEEAKIGERDSEKEGP
jgi:hypothetical protein